jgi:F0F1-type ATP synthase membrane subunit c/vacuolar-type H+-ATPase subunit K
MSTSTQSNLDAIKDIRKIMERSSRFISLSGWSGISAGICALIGAWVAQRRAGSYFDAARETDDSIKTLRSDLILIAAAVFASALILAFLFTYLKSKKEGVAIWGNAARRLLWNTLLPMVVGGTLIIKMYMEEYDNLIIPSMLIFYGLALINGSKYTMGEVRYLGYGEVLTGIISLVIVSNQLYIWAFGFGVLHIIYGISMWRKYDRTSGKD